MYDMKHLEKLDKIGTLAPAAMAAFWAFDKAAMAAGEIPVKYKELIAIAVAHTTQCLLHRNPCRPGARRRCDRR
jgi:alkylhydroperoxidase/carboxymuconolactone decarboxylase family protein YurZ